MLTIGYYIIAKELKGCATYESVLNICISNFVTACRKNVKFTQIFYYVLN